MQLCFTGVESLLDVFRFLCLFFDESLELLLCFSAGSISNLALLFLELLLDILECVLLVFVQIFKRLFELLDLVLHALQLTLLRPIAFLVSLAVLCVLLDQFVDALDDFVVLAQFLEV